MPRYALAIDQGTTNTKALLVREDGAIAAAASRPVPIHFPQPGWVEQDARELWQSVLGAVGECLGRAGAARPDVIGISNQRESVLVWERASGQPIGPCLTWQCRRTAPFCAELRARGLNALLTRRTGLAIDPVFSASKARWLLDRTPHGNARAANGELAIGTVDSWLLWNLTAGAAHATDLTNASRTQLLDLSRLQWDEELLSIFGIPAAALPALHPSSHIYGETAACTDIPAGIPIGALAGDSHAALFGHAIFTPGAIKATYGTGSSLMTITAQPVWAAGLSTAIAWSRDEGARETETKFALEGNIFTTGGAVQWLGEFLGLPDPVEDAVRLAASVPDSAGVYLVPAFAGLGAPHWNDAARGLLCGLTRGSGAAHAARAAVDSIAYQVRDVLEAMEQAGGAPIPALLADGGGTRNASLMQFQADILDRPVVRSAAADVSAMGAAWLAGLASGIWPSLHALAALPREEQRFEPAMKREDRARLYDGWREAVRQAIVTTPGAPAGKA